MTIHQQFLLVQNDVIRTLDNRFVQSLDANLTIKFRGQYPQKYEDLLMTGTYNFQVRVNNIFYSPYSDEFFELTSKVCERDYIVKYAFLHNYCFSQFCTYFEIMASALSSETAKAYLEEYRFYLDIQIGTNNEEYKVSYKRYWREILLRVITVLQSENHSFYNRFNVEQRQKIIDDLSIIEKEIQP